MTESRLLILGANGQLGRALQQRFPKAQTTDRTTIDLSDPKSIKGYDWSGVDVIINTAAYTNVDGAETPEGRKAAWQINASGVAELAKVATKRNLTLVHVSTDYVFDGTQTPHTEDEPLTPLSVYGQSKAAGDIAASCVPRHYILRTSWVVGKGKNFVRTMIGLAAKGISPTVVADQIGRLTFTPTLVDAIEHLLKTKTAAGIYNISNDGEPDSWADITRLIFTMLGAKLTVTDTTTTAYYADKTGIAPRPPGSTLDLSKIKATGLRLRDWRDDLQAYIDGQPHETR